MRPRILTLCVLASASLILEASAGGRDEDEVEYKERTEIDFSAMEISAELSAPVARFGATPGGSQDSGPFTAQVQRGHVPKPAALTAEGLLSEYDLPLQPSGPCDRLLCTETRAHRVSLAPSPETDALLQLGFSSGLTAESFERPPVNLVAVVDRSCSMSGEPIDTVRASLHAIADQLRPEDQLSIVTYGSSVDTELVPTRGTKKGELRVAIEGIRVNGSTNMEAGLVNGFAIARETRRPFDGVTRVLLFTDEQPNVGRTDAGSFMGMARKASRDGVGLTTFGVGTHFGAELARKISAVRGGNLFFFADPASMRETIAERFDFMVTELAYDMDLRITPARGSRITGLYGLPGDAVQWEGRSLSMRLETLFLSDKKGAIFLGLSGPDGRAPSADVALTYTPRDGARESQSETVRAGRIRDGDVGLVRGAVLVDAYASIRTALVAFHLEGDPAAARSIVRGLQARLRESVDPELAPLRTTVDQLAINLGAATAPGVPDRDLVSGLPVK